MARDEALPPWMRSWVRDSAASAGWDRADLDALNEARHFHVDFGRRLILPKQDMASAPADISSAFLGAAITAPISDLDWDFYAEAKRRSERRHLQIPSLIAMISAAQRLDPTDREGVQPEWEATDPERETTAAINEFARYLERCKKKGPAILRRACRAALGMNDPNHTAVFTNNANGDVDPYHIDSYQSSLRVAG